MSNELTDHERSCLLQVAAAVQNELNEALALGDAARILKLSQMIFGDAANITKTIDWIVPAEERLLPNLAVTIFTLDGEVRYAFSNSDTIHVEFAALDEESVFNEEHLLKLQDNVAQKRYGWRELSFQSQEEEELDA